MTFTGTLVCTSIYLFRRHNSTNCRLFAKFNWICWISAKGFISLQGITSASSHLSVDMWKSPTHKKSCVSLCVYLCLSVCVSVCMCVSVCLCLYACHLCVCSLQPDIKWNSTLRDYFLGSSPRSLVIKLTVTCIELELSGCICRVRDTEKMTNVTGEIRGRLLPLVIQVWRGFVVDT